MEKDNNTQLLSAYYNSCNDLLQAFCNRHDFDYDDKESWVAGDVGDVACCGDYFFNMDVIVTDLEEEPDKNELIRWYDYDMRCNYLGIPSVNYYSWLNGCPIRTEEELQKLEEAQKRVMDAERAFRKMLAEYN